MADTILTDAELVGADNQTIRDAVHEYATRRWRVHLSEVEYRSDRDETTRRLHERRARLRGA